jgi:hypothetical protein
MQSTLATKKGKQQAEKDRADLEKKYKALEKQHVDLGPRLTKMGALEIEVMYMPLKIMFPT